MMDTKKPKEPKDYAGWVKPAQCHVHMAKQANAIAEQQLEINRLKALVHEGKQCSSAECKFPQCACTYWCAAPHTRKEDADKF